MTSAKSSNLYNIVAALACGAASLILPVSADAQDPGYAPPPMFEDMTPPMVRPEGQDGYLVTPKASINTQLPEPTPPRPPVVTPRVSVDPDAPPRPAPATPVPVAPVAPPPVIAPVVPTTPAPAKPQMMKPIVEETYIKREKPASKKETVKKAEEPRTESVKKPKPTPAPSAPVVPVAPKEDISTQKAPPPPSAEAPVIAPVPRDPSQSAIQGPKTMPALPTESVDEQVIFDSKAPPPPETIMERHRKEVEEKKNDETLMPIVPRPNPNVTPSTFDPGAQGVLKKTIVLQPGQIGLVQADADPIIAGVVKELDSEDKKDWRVQIRAFATPSGTGLSSDRRIALSRALSLRSSMISQGVPASKIDVMAEGLQTTGAAPGDRIDLYLFGPSGQ